MAHWKYGLRRLLLPAMVDAGLVRGVGPGVTEIVATFDNGKSASARIHVERPVGALRLRVDRDTVAMGDTVRVTLVAVDAAETLVPEAIIPLFPDDSLVTVASEGARPMSSINESARRGRVSLLVRVTRAGERRISGSRFYRTPTRELSAFGRVIGVRN